MLENYERKPWPEREFSGSQFFSQRNCIRCEPAHHEVQNKAANACWAITCTKMLSFLTDFIQELAVCEPFFLSLLTPLLILRQNLWDLAGFLRAFTIWQNGAKMTFLAMVLESLGMS